MNSDIQPVKNNDTSTNLKKGHNAQIYKCNNINDLQKPDSSLSPTSYISPSSAKNIKNNSDKNQIRKLVDSKQVSSGPFHQSDKKIFLLDTYAQIAAMNNKRCPKRLRELAKPKRQAHSDQNDYSANFDLNYGHATKTYMTEIRRSLKESKKK